MYKTLIILLFGLFILSCSSEQTSNKNIQIATLQLDKYSPKTAFDNCLPLKTYQFLAASKEHLEQFIRTELLSEGEDLAVGYQRYVTEWTGREQSTMNTEKLLTDGFAKAFYTHSNFKNIWIPLTELGDTIYTEELAYDENGHGVVVKYIENYYTLNTKSDYYNCLKQIKSADIQNYLINKEYGDIEPQDFALELENTLDFDAYNNTVLQTIIMTELYLKIIAIREKNNQ